jgi:hypothetical protein
MNTERSKKADQVSEGAPVRLLITKGFTLNEEGRGRREFVAGNIYHFNADEAEVVIGRGDAVAFSDALPSTATVEAGTVTASKDHYPATNEVKPPETSRDHPPTDLPKEKK